jgi:MOSC domain-containing protein YiiM
MGAELNATVGSPRVIAVAAAEKHLFSKETKGAINLIVGVGVEGDAHCGTRVQHLCDMRKNPARPNLRQVHLIEQELITELNTIGFSVTPGQLGENITTRHLNLLELNGGTILQLGTTALVKVTGLRAPCLKLDRLQRGLKEAVTVVQSGKAYMKGAVMGVVIVGGTVSSGDIIQVRTTDASLALEPV